MVKNKFILALVLIVAIAALVLSIVALVNSNEKEGISGEVYEIFGDCGWKTGELPSADYSTCEEHCDSTGDKICITATFRRGTELYVGGCGSSIDSNPNGMTSYQCLCC